MGYRRKLERPIYPRQDKKENPTEIKTRLYLN